MKKPDASLTLLSPRSSLDLLVDDKTINDLYHVELKSTKQVSSRCPREPSGLKPAPTPDAASSDGVPSQLPPWPRRWSTLLARRGIVAPRTFAAMVDVMVGGLRVNPFPRYRRRW